MGLFASLFGAGDAQATGDELDAKLADMNQKDYAPGGHINDLIVQDQGQAAADQAYQTVQTDEASGATGDVEGQIQGEFAAGAMEGLNNVLTAPGKAASGIFGGAGTLLWGVIKNIPWWVWLGLGAYVFFSLGGMHLLKRKLAMH